MDEICRIGIIGQIPPTLATARKTYSGLFLLRNVLRVVVGGVKCIPHEPLAKVFHITLYYGSDSVFYLTFQVLGTL